MSTTPQNPEGVAPSIPAASSVEDKRKAPTGAIPRQVQTWVILGLSVFIIVAIWLSNATNAKKNTPGKSATSGIATTPEHVSGLTPEDVSRRLELAERNRQAAETPAMRVQEKHGIKVPDAADIPDKQFVAAATQSQRVTTDPIEEDRRKRIAMAPFASNVALSYRGRNTEAAEPSRRSAVLGNGSDQTMQAVQEQLAQAMAQQQALASKLGLPGVQAPNAQAPRKTDSAQPAQKHETVNLNQATGKPHVLYEGTMLETVLVNRLNGDFTGPVICLVTNDLYSHDRTHILIPSGTKVFGEAQRVTATGQSRLAVAFHRIIMPDGYTVNLDQAPALNQIGETALKDKVNNHYFKVFGSAIAIGGIAGFSQLYGNTGNISLNGTLSPEDAYRQGIASSLSTSATRIMDKFLNELPTITIREGHRVKVYFTQDVMLPAYSQHKMPSDL